ncbi:MAG: YceI family protein [Dyella sp.]
MFARKLLAFAALFGATAVTQAAPVSYQLDPTHTDVLFSWNHFGFANPSAHLSLSEGTLVYDEAKPAESTVEVTFPLTNLDSFVPQLDDELKSDKFFDAAKYPTITFKSTKVQSLGGGKFKVTGDLTVHGVTKPVVLDAKLNKLGEQPMMKVQAIGFDATATIKRSDFGVGAYVPSVSDEVKIHITTEAHAAK